MPHPSGSLSRIRLVTRKNILYSLVMAALMSLLMSGVITVANTGMDTGITRALVRG